LASNAGCLHPDEKVTQYFSLDLFGLQNVPKTTKYEKEFFCLPELNTKAK
jgi:hypothetical protein